MDYCNYKHTYYEHHYRSQSYRTGWIVARLLPSLNAKAISSLFYFKHLFKSYIYLPHPTAVGRIMHLTTWQPRGLHRLRAISSCFKSYLVIGIN